MEILVARKLKFVKMESQNMTYSKFLLSATALTHVHTQNYGHHDAHSALKSKQKASDGRVEEKK
jgi:hypothetical protein